MKRIIHNLKVALRNLMKYKLQTCMSVLSIAIGIVTLSFAVSVMDRFRLPSLLHESYSDRAYKVSFHSGEDDEMMTVTNEIIRAVKRDGGPASAEQMAVPNGMTYNILAEFHSGDSIIGKGRVDGRLIDPAYPPYSGLRSAITGEKIRQLRKGEAIIGEDMASDIFHGSNPIGAVQTNTDYVQTIPVTIVDVYERPSVSDFPFAGGGMFFCTSDSVEDFDQKDYNGMEHYYAVWINMVLREGCTERQLLEEVRARVAPMGIEPQLEKALDSEEINTLILSHVIVYVIGSLILLAAIIGFLRIQTQLFWLRSREVSLRIVNGASRRQLFSLLFTEVLIVVLLSVGVAVVLGILLQDFMAGDRSGLIGDIGLFVNGLWVDSVAIGGGLLVLCGVIAWVTVARVCDASRGLAASMRRGRNHLFRNVMLGLQITICMIFVCCTFILVNCGNKMLKASNVPADDSVYKEYLIFKPGYSEHPERLIEEVSALPELGRMIMCSEHWTPINAISFDPELKEKFRGRTHYPTYFTTDTAMLSAVGMDVEWSERDVDHGNCVLISEALYNDLYESGILANNNLYFYTGVTKPVGGIIKNIPYDSDGRSIVAISPEWDQLHNDYVLIPEPGKGKALARSVDELIARIDPDVINKIASNYRDSLTFVPAMVETVVTGGWILCGVSIVICAMGIFSTIVLDTRARRKEVAIRKVNGAKGRDIRRMFGRVYVALIVVSVIVALPVCLLFNEMMQGMLNDMMQSPLKEQSDNIVLSPVMPIVLGIMVVVMLIFAIVGWQVRKVMRVDPARIIAKE